MKERRYLLKKQELVSCMKMNGLKQIDLADLLNISDSTLSTKISGKTSCSSEEVEKLATLFNILPYKIATFTTFPTRSKLNYYSSFVKDKVLNKEAFYECLKKEDITVSQFCRIMDVNEDSVHRWTTHLSNPRTRIIDFMCEYFDISVDNLFINECSKSTSESAKEDAPLDEAPSKEEAAIKNPLGLKPFDEGNVLDNMKTINDNIIVLSSYIQSQFSLVFEKIDLLNQKLDAVATDESIKEKENVPRATLVIPSKTRLSDSAILSICKGNCKEDSLSSYKDKIRSLLTYIGWKEGHVYNQVASDYYKKFEKIYGMSLNMMKKGCPNATDTIMIIYSDKAVREIFFNLVATDASHLAGDCLTIDPEK